MNKSSHRNQRNVGTQYERLAGRYLMSLGYEILEYNFRCRVGEIDLIARDGEYLVFCEVKYRADERSGEPMEAVDRKKQCVISKCAAYYLMRHGDMELPCRFDVIGIRGDRIAHIKNAFEYIE